MYFLNLGVKGLSSFTPKSDQFQISPANIPPHSMKNLAFHSFLRGKMIKLPTFTKPLFHWEIVLFELGSE